MKKMILCVLCALCVDVISVRAQIPIDQVQILNSPDVREWTPTATITKVEFWRGAGIHFEFDKASAWPDVVPPGWQGPVQYTVWILLKTGDAWYASGIIECWRDRQSTDDTDVTENNQIARNWLYDSRWGPMQGHQPQPGERVGFMLTAGDARGKDVHGVAERSRIVEIAWPSSSGFSAPFVWVEGASLLPVPTIPPPVQPVPPVLPSVDLSPVLMQLATLSGKIDQLAKDEAVFHDEVRSEWTRISKFVVTYVAPIVGAIFAGRATK